MNEPGLGATDLPLNVAAAEGEVVVMGQDNAVSIALTPAAAAETGRRLIEVAKSAEAGGKKAAD